MVVPQNSLGGEVWIHDVLQSPLKLTPVLNALPKVPFGTPAPKSAKTANLPLHTSFGSACVVTVECALPSYFNHEPTNQPASCPIIKNSNLVLSVS